MLPQLYYFSCKSPGKRWGEGKTSSSDSHIVSFREKVLQQEYSVKFGDFALKFYKVLYICS